MRRSEAEQLKSRYDLLSAITTIIGFLVSIYGLYVEIMMDKYGTEYTPLCDISSYISCSKPLHSRFAIGLGIVEHIFGPDHILNQRNALYGVLMYILLLPIQFMQFNWAITLTVYICIFLNLLTVYLFAILVYLRVICLVCYAIYIINGALLVLSIKRRQVAVSLSKKRS